MSAPAAAVRSDTAGEGWRTVHFTGIPKALWAVLSEFMFCGWTLKAGAAFEADSSAPSHSERDRGLDCKCVTVQGGTHSLCVFSLKESVTEGRVKSLFLLWAGGGGRQSLC